MNTIDVGDKKLALYFQGELADRLASRSLDLDRVRRIVRPLMTRPALIVVHANNRCRCVSGSWYGRARTFRYFNCHYRDFDGDVVTLLFNPEWIARRRVRHGPYYLTAANRFRRYPWQGPMDAMIYVLAHEFSHHFLFARRHPMRFSERATDLFTIQHLHRVEPTHPISRCVRLTSAELGQLLELLRRMPPPREQHRKLSRRVACKRR